jgi:adenylate cyclase
MASSLNLPAPLKLLNALWKVQDRVARMTGETKASQSIELRIGVNVGDVMVEDGDVFGDGVNVAARLEGLSDPGRRPFVSIRL